MLDLTKIVEKIRHKEGFKNDAQVAALLNISKQNLSSYKTRGTLPYEELIKYCDDRKLSLDWIRTDNTAEHCNESLSSFGDPRLLALIDKISKIYNTGTQSERADVYGIIEAVMQQIENRQKGE